MPGDTEHINPNHPIPWSNVVEAPRTFMEVSALPEGFVFKHPRDYDMAEVSTLYRHLYDAQEGKSNPAIRFAWLVSRAPTKQSHRGSAKSRQGALYFGRVTLYVAPISHHHYHYPSQIAAIRLLRGSDPVSPYYLLCA